SGRATEGSHVRVDWNCASPKDVLAVASLMAIAEADLHHVLRSIAAAYADFGTFAPSPPLSTAASPRPQTFGRRPQPLASRLWPRRYTGLHDDRHCCPAKLLASSTVAATHHVPACRCGQTATKPIRDLARHLT